MVAAESRCRKIQHLQAQAKTENAELQQRVKELEARLAELEPQEEKKAEQEQAA